LKSIIVDWKMVGIVGGAMLAGGAMIGYAFFRPAVDPEEAERKRRLHMDPRGAKLRAGNDRLYLV